MGKDSETEKPVKALTNRLQLAPVGPSLGGGDVGQLEKEGYHPSRWPRGGASLKHHAVVLRGSG